MKAVLCTRYGDPEDLQLVELAEPIPAPRQVVVAVKSAALNFFDLLVIAGKYQIKPRFPFSPGGEFAGVVESVGAGVTEFRRGERVVGYCVVGAACERLAIEVERIVKLPQQLNFNRAAGLPITYGTSLYALKDRSQLREGETLAVLGASGGAGLSAVEIGKLLGARVIACASSTEKLAFATEHGADDVVNYHTEDLGDALHRLNGGRGVDVVYDPIGGPLTEAALRSLNWTGRLLVIGFASGEITKLPLNLLTSMSCDVIGVNFGAWSTREARSYRANMAQIISWCIAGNLSAHVHAICPLHQVVDALRLLSDRKVMGKVILCP